MTPPPVVDLDRYLARIGFDRRVETDRATLEALQRAHLTAVPFENLDVYTGSGVRTDLAWSLDKVVRRGRGGWCFELNGAFSALLEAIGFGVTRMAATVIEGDTPAPTPDHLTLRVDLDRPYLVDVGFGASGPIHPLALDRTDAQDGGFTEFRISSVNSDRVLERRRNDGSWLSEFRFSMVDREMSAFEPASQRLQAGPGHFTDAPFATRLIDGGPDRISLTPERLVIHRGEVVEETPVPTAAWDDTLRSCFGIRISASPPVDDRR